MSYNRAPAADLAPWIGRLYATKVDLPDDYEINCGLFNDTLMVRIQLAGEWTAQTPQGRLTHGKAALLFGPHTHRMPITVKGSFISMGYSLRPGAATVLKGPRVADFLDRIASTEDIGAPARWLLKQLDPEASPEEWLQVLEYGMRKWLEHVDSGIPDPITTRFENVAFTNPGTTIEAFARDCGVNTRTVERIIGRDFGLSPKQVLKRARALDMASHLRGVGDHAEAEELVLRYYDQSHLIREFTELFGMSPSQFVATPQPLLTLALESRQARRLEAIERLAPGSIRPWE